MSYKLKLDEEIYQKAISEGQELELPKRNIGFIADEVLEVVPELVRTSPDGTKALAYQNITALNVEAIKEQQEMILNLKSELSQLRDSLNTVLNQVNNRSNSSFSNSFLFQNKPNPFDRKTIIEFDIDSRNFTHAKIFIFNMSGTLISDYNISKPGKGSYVLNADTLSAGMYIYTLVINDQEVDSKRMIISK